MNKHLTLASTITTLLITIFSLPSPSFAVPSNTSVANNTSRLNLQCVSNETEKNSTVPSVSIETRQSIGQWDNGKWIQLNDTTLTSGANKPLASYGSATVYIEKKSYILPATMLVSNNKNGNIASYTGKSIGLSLQTKDELFTPILHVNLLQDGTIIAHLACNNLSSFAATKLSSLAAAARAPGAKTLTPVLAAARGASPSASTTTTTTTTTTKPAKYCNTNKPTGLASCPAGMFQISSDGANSTFTTDTSVTTGSVCSSISVADANALAVADANARAAGALNCTYKCCGCYYTPDGTCPPGEIQISGSPPTCGDDSCFYATDSQASADSSCKASAAQNPTCSTFKPTCLTTTTTTSTSTVTTSPPSPSPSRSPSPKPSSSRSPTTTVPRSPSPSQSASSPLPY